MTPKATRRPIRRLVWELGRGPGPDDPSHPGAPELEKQGGDAKKEHWSSTNART
jgi:hypothetical protein